MNGLRVKIKRKMRKLNQYIPFVNLLFIGLAHLLQYFGVVSWRGIFIGYQFTDFGILMTIYCLNLVYTCKLCNLTKNCFRAFIVICVMNVVWTLFFWDLKSGEPIYLNVYDWFFYPVVGIALTFDGYAIYKHIKNNREKKRKQIFNG